MFAAAFIIPPMGNADQMPSILNGIIGLTLPIARWYCTCTKCMNSVRCGKGPAWPRLAGPLLVRLAPTGHDSWHAGRRRHGWLAHHGPTPAGRTAPQARRSSPGEQFHSALVLRRQAAVRGPFFTRPSPAGAGRTAIAPCFHGSRSCGSQPSLCRLHLLWSAAPHHDVERATDGASL